jgi:hypothetical protein
MQQLNADVFERLSVQILDETSLSYNIYRNITQFL